MLSRWRRWEEKAGGSFHYSQPNPSWPGRWLTQFYTLELNIDLFTLIYCLMTYLPSSSAQVILVRYVDGWHNSMLIELNIDFFTSISPPSTRRLYWSRKNTKPISSFLVISYQDLAIMTTPRSRLWLLFAGCTSFNVPLFWAKNPPLQWSNDSAGALFNAIIPTDWGILLLSKSPFLGYPTCLLFDHMIWVDGTVHSKDNKVEKTREVADIKIFH